MWLRFTTAILALALCSSLVWGVWASWDVRDLERKVTDLRLAKDSCEKRHENIEKDRERDEEVSDPDFVIPPSWYVPGTTGSDP